MKISEPYIFVSCDEGLYQAHNAGCSFVGVLDVSNGGCEVMRDGDVKIELSAFDQFILLLPPGSELLRDDVAIRLGDARVKWAYWVPDGIPITDAIASARPMWNDEIATIDDIPDEGEQVLYESGFQLLDEHGFRFTLPAFVPLIGPYGSGKSVFLRQLLVNLWRLHGFKSLLTSFEERVKPTFQRDFRRHLIGKPIDRWTMADVVGADDEMRNCVVFLRRKRRAILDADNLLRLIEFAVRVHGIRVVAIDPVNELDLTPGRGESKTDMMGRFLMNLKALADDYNLLIIVAAHPPKAGVEKRMANTLLTLNDGADTAHWGNKADIGLCVWRKLDGATLLHVDKTKVHEVNGKPVLAEMRLDAALGKFEVTRLGYDILDPTLPPEPVKPSKQNGSRYSGMSYADQ